MFNKILIANRGEIAVRIIRACREMDISAVAVYSEADRESLHVLMADEAYCVGPPENARSYLNIPNIISAALLSGADAVHPGYGYLSEKAHFAEICEEHGIKFIGPPPSALDRMGDKAVARRIADRAGVPIAAGSPGPVASVDEAASVAGAVGYPVMIKATAGGGGKGLRVIRDERELRRSFATAASEAEVSFGSRELYIEKYIEIPRHVEVQILADSHGSIIHLGERDCSVQRRGQKVVEESPSPAITPRVRKAMADAAVKVARAAGYVGAGTVEFLVDRSGRFYFIEMNTRIQVEHPVTEMVTGIDLVREQIRIAAGGPLGRKQSDVSVRGHALECRINAEDPEKGFRSCPGRIGRYHVPGGHGVRVDSCAYAGYSIPPYYDSMFGKLIVWADDRDRAIRRMARALDEFEIDGIKTTIPFHSALIRSDAFREAKIYANQDPISVLGSDFAK
jgi:acetyl-CoA carboxylase biotin carboxylase subunit